MLKRLQAWRRARIRQRHAIPDGLWSDVVAQLHVLDHLDANDVARLRDLVALFLYEKTIVGAHELRIDDRMRVTIAAQACLPILNFQQTDQGLSCYRGWRTVILYPGAFVAHREIEDDTGLVHSGFEELDGESADGGPVVLSWEEAQPRPSDEIYNVVIHEFAHKLDELTGPPNGLPPLHADMRIETWSTVMSRAFEAFNAMLDRDEGPPFDDYAGTDPAEFFAVLSELFFAAPDVVIEAYPDVYAQLRTFYRQDPIAAYESVSR